MLFQVKGQVVSTVVLNERNAGEHEIYNILSNDLVKSLHMELESVQYMIASYSNPSIKLEEMFDGGDDEWHGSVEITSDVSVLVEADSEEIALDIMNAYYDDSFAVDKAYVFVDGGEMLELDPQDSTYITWKTATVHEGETPEGISIVVADLH